MLKNDDYTKLNTSQFKSVVRIRLINHQHHSRRSVLPTIPTVVVTRREIEQVAYDGLMSVKCSELEWITVSDGCDCTCFEHI